MKSLAVLVVCAAAALLAGISLFASGYPVAHGWLDGLFLFSAAMVLAVLVHFLLVYFQRRTSSDIDELDKPPHP